MNNLSKLGLTVILGLSISYINCNKDETDTNTIKSSIHEISRREC